METEQSNSQTTTTSGSYKLPSGVTLQHCAKIAIVEDRPIMLITGHLPVIKKFLLVSVKVVKNCLLKMKKNTPVQFQRFTR